MGFKGPYLFAMREQARRRFNELRPEAARFAAASMAKQAREKALAVLPYIDQARKAGASTLGELARALTARGVATPSGRGVWHLAIVRRAIAYAAS